MRIIKHGKLKNKNATFIVKCPNCGCVFECNEKELKAHVEYQNHYAYADCPECKEECRFLPGKAVKF